MNVNNNTDLGHHTHLCAAEHHNVTKKTAEETEPNERLRKAGLLK
jgi:hypothetical protein